MSSHPFGAGWGAAVHAADADKSLVGIALGDQGQKLDQQAVAPPVPDTTER
jgi:hypothetical protein